MSDWKPRTGQRIERLYAWIATEADGGEGICAMTLPELGTVPLIGADKARIESLREQARFTALESRRPVRLVEFATRRVLEDKP